MYYAGPLPLPSSAQDDPRQACVELVAEPIQLRPPRVHFADAKGEGRLCSLAKPFGTMIPAPAKLKTSNNNIVCDVGHVGVLAPWYRPAGPIEDRPYIYIYIHPRTVMIRSLDWVGIYPRETADSWSDTQPGVSAFGWGYMPSDVPTASLEMMLNSPRASSAPRRLARGRVAPLGGSAAASPPSGQRGRVAPSGQRRRPPRGRAPVAPRGARPRRPPRGSAAACAPLSLYACRWFLFLLPSGDDSWAELRRITFEDVM